MNIEFIDIIVALIALIGLALTYYVVPILKSKFTSQEIEKTYSWVFFAVQAAEQLAKAGLIAVPKVEYVIDFLEKKGISLTQEELEVLIEAAVFEMNRFNENMLSDGK